MSRLFSRLALTAVAVAGLAGFATLARADDLRDYELHIPYEKVNFNDPAAVKQLYNRLKDAAYFLCEDEVEGAQLQTCVGQKLTTAVAQVNHQELSRIEEPQFLVNPVELTMNSPQLKPQAH